MDTEQAPNQAQLEKAVAVYIALRTQKAELEARHKQELAPIRQRMQQAEDLFLEVLNTLGASSVKTLCGTPYKKDVTSLKIEDWSAALAHIQEHGSWELLKKDLVKTAVLERIEAGEPIPGVTVSVYTKVFVQAK